MSEDVGRAGEIRISDADREQAARPLHTALAEGRITLVELDERLAQVYAARFAGDLGPPPADLPADQLIRRPAPVPVAESADEVLVLRTRSGRIKRQGAWLLPARLSLEVTSGSVLLNLGEAVMQHPVVMIEVSLNSGSIKLLVPDGVTADVDRVATRTGWVRSTVPSVPTGNGVHLVLSGSVGSGVVRIRTPRRLRAR